MHREGDVMVGEKIKKLRLSLGLTQTEFARKLFVTPAAVSQWESNNTRPDMDRLMKISKEFSVSLDYFSDDPSAKTYTEAELIKQHILIELGATQPKTIEAKIISGAVDRMPKEKREQAINIMKAVFDQYSDYFERKEDDE